MTKIYFYLENLLQINTWFYYFLTNNYFIVKGYPQCANCLAWGAHLEHALGHRKKHLRKLVKKKWTWEWLYEPLGRSAEYQQYRSLNTIEEEDESFEEKMATQAQNVPQNDQRITSTSSAGSG